MSRHEEPLEKGTPDWPYPVNYGRENEIDADVLVLGGGIAGCHAAISAAKRGARVAVVDKGPVIRSGSGGSGVDRSLSKGKAGTKASRFVGTRAKRRRLMHRAVPPSRIVTWSAFCLTTEASVSQRTFCSLKRISQCSPGSHRTGTPNKVVAD